MKFLALLVLIALITNQLTAQVAHFQRRINFKTFEKDSINLPLNNAYFLIEDSCAQIVRYAHYSFKRKIFSGKFKDVSVATPGLVVAEGNYTDDGMKNGRFTLHYLNGNLEAEGNFKNNKYDGKWELFYDSGKPELSFEDIDNSINIIDAWKPEGTKTVDNGNGTYQSVVGAYYWKGKLVNGKPDGTWKFIKSDDVSEVPIITESYKKGQFHKGTSPVGEYTDASRVVLVDPDLLPVTNAEKMQISMQACDGSGFKHIAAVQYKYGLDDFTEEIKRVITPYFNKINVSGLSGDLSIDGEVSENGSLDKLKCSDPSAQQISRNIILILEGMPLLQPATSNGKPIKARFSILFHFQSGLYSFNYKFQPLN